MAERPDTPRVEALVWLLGVAILALLLAGPVGAAQYSPPDTVPSSVVPLNTDPAAIPLVAARLVRPVESPLLLSRGAESGEAFEIIDKEPLALPADALIFSGPNATDAEAAAAELLGVLPAETEVVLTLLRGTRVYAYLPESETYVWIEVPDLPSEDEPSEEVPDLRSEE